MGSGPKQLLWLSFDTAQATRTQLFEIAVEGLTPTCAKFHPSSLLFACVAPIPLLSELQPGVRLFGRQHACLRAALHAPAQEAELGSSMADRSRMTATQHTRALSAMAFSFDGTRLYSVGLDGAVVLHDFQVMRLDAIIPAP